MEQIDQYKNISLLNVDTQPIEIVWDGDSYGYIQPGEVKRLPQAIADLVLKHLIDQILNRLDIRTSNEKERARLAAEIIVDSDEGLKVMKNQKEELDETINELNAPSDLEKIVKLKEEKAAKDLENAPIIEEIEEEVVEPVSQDDFIGLKQDVIPLSEASKQDLMDYAKNVLKMQMDPKTENTFLKMTKKQMAEEIDYPKEDE